MTILAQAARTAVTTSLVYLTLIEAKSGLVASLIRPFVPWS